MGSHLDSCLSLGIRSPFFYTPKQNVEFWNWNSTWNLHFDCESLPHNLKICTLASLHCLGRRDIFSCQKVNTGFLFWHLSNLWKTIKLKSVAEHNCMPTLACSRHWTISACHLSNTGMYKLFKLSIIVCQLQIHNIFGRFLSTQRISMEY